MASKKPTIAEIVAMRWDLAPIYENWHRQQDRDVQFYNAPSETEGIRISASTLPANFDQVRLPTGKTIIDTAAEHAAGNFPRIHVPRRRETESAQEASTLLEKAAQGFWYRSIAEASLNPLRAWAQIGGLHGAICGSLLYNEDKWPDLPKKPETESGEAWDEYEDAVARRKNLWPFELDYIDPRTVYVDPSTEGRDFVIVAFVDKVYAVKRRWPKWDKRMPGRTEPLKDTDTVEFISYWDDRYNAYIVGNQGGLAATGGDPKGYALINAYDGVAPHKYGFLPYFFQSAGYGTPTGKPEHKYQGLLTPILDLLRVEMRRMTHLDAIIAQQAFPWLVAQFGVEPNMELGGVTRVPQGTPIRDAIIEMRPVVPVAELVQEIELVKSRIEGATIPDTLSGLRPKGIYSGYHESILVGTGRARLRPLTDGLQHAVNWATSGFFKLVENKIKGPVSVWGKGMAKNDFVTLKPSDINGAYEVYASLVPDLPQDTAVDIANGARLMEHGVIPGRDFLETYAHRENAEDLLRERAAEDVLKDPALRQQFVADVLAGFGVPSYTPGAVGAPGFTTGLIPAGGAPPNGAPAAAPANPQSMAGIPNQPTPPGGSVGPPPGGAAALAGIPRGSGSGGYG